ncbi:MAG: FAD-dependent oxidoreductase [Clostridiaceae bacterium]|nr:FAD-dependent oxidoreductase [Clostridiaceae bacterium]
MKTSDKRRILVIGAVAAGTSAAAKARRNDEDAEIVIYEMDSDISYSGCGLPYYIGGSVPDIKTLTPRDPEFFLKKYNVDIKTGHQVMSGDSVAKTITVKNLETGVEFSDHYDVLVIATGARAIMPPIPGVELPHVFKLRNPSDARAIRAYIDNNKPRKAAVIGSGFIGLEMVENLMAAGLEIDLVEKLADICPFVDPDMAPHLAERLEKEGVKIHAGTAAVSIKPDKIELDDGNSLQSDLVIMAVGVKPNVSLAESLGVNLGTTGAIAVDNCMRTNVESIFACGDCAEAFSLVDGRPLYRPLGSTANKMGRIAGDMISGGCLNFRGIVGTGIFKVFDMAVAACGLNEKEARDSGFDVVVSHNIKPDKPGYFGGREMVIKAIADRKSERLLGVQIIGYEGVDKRIDVFVTAITGGLLVSDLFHLDLAYAPPFSTTKDPVMYTGMILDNAINRDRDLVTADEIGCCDKGTYQIVDARVAAQYANSHVDDAISMPHDEIRELIDSLDPSKPVVTYCNKGTTGNAAQNVLINKGFAKVYNLSGGHRQYDICRRKNRETNKSE